MKPSDYRLAGYKNKTKQNNFYDGTLKLGFLAGINDNISEHDIWKAQKNAIITYCKTLEKEKILKPLNNDLLQFAQAANKFDTNEHTIVNNLNDSVDKLLIDYSPTVSTTRKEKIDPEKGKKIMAQLNNLFKDYSLILNQINTASFSHDTHVQNFTIVKQLESLSDKINSLKTVVNSYVTNDARMPNQEISSYFYQIYNMLLKVKGFVLEEEVVNTADNWLPTGMKIIGTGAVTVGGTQVGVDNMVLSELIMNEPFEYMIAAPNSDKKIKIQGTIGSFIEDLSKNRSQSFSLDDSEYQRLCKLSIATIQAKASGSRAKSIIFNRGQQLFESAGSKRIESKTIPNIELKRNVTVLNKKYLNILLGMKNLYELSKALNGGIKSNYLQSAKSYQGFANLQLSQMISYILKNNQYLLSNKYGLISFADLFKRQQNVYFSWGKNKTLNIAKLEQLKYNIILNI